MTVFSDAARCNVRSIFKESNLSTGDRSVKSGREARKTLLVMIHGFLGGKKTWGVLKAILDADKLFSARYKIEFYQYKTKLLPYMLPGELRKQRISDFSDALSSWVACQGHEQVALCAHSMGGLIARKMVLNHQQSLAADVMTGQDNRRVKLTKLALIAVPNLGTEISRAGLWFDLSNIYLRQMLKGSEFLDSLNVDWARSRIEEQIQVLYAVGTEDRVVSLESARNCFSERFCPINGEGHSSVIKPKSESSMIVNVLKKFFKDAA